MCSYRGHHPADEAMNSSLAVNEVLGKFSCLELQFLELMKELLSFQASKFYEARFPSPIGQDRKRGQGAKPFGWETEKNPCMIQLKHMEGRKH